MVKYDFNKLEKRASDLKNIGQVEDALAIYFFMADGDSSLDAGYLGLKIGECYESLGRLRDAKYWFNRAVEENPEVTEYINAKSRLLGVNIDDVIPRNYYLR